MANPIVNLSVRANTAKALSDFKRFSDSLNNKFLVSGLKVELISSTLRQINSELQKSIGEQGLLGASSMRAAQNQAAFLTSTFKGFSLEAAKSINENMTKALSDVAVKAGGTVSDIKKTMAGVPYISTSLSSAERTKMAEQMFSLQRNLRRAGINDQFGDLASKFLSGGTTVGDMVNSGDPLASKIGMTMMTKYKVQYGQIYNAETRTKVLQQVLNDPEITRFVQDQAKKTYGFRIYIEDLNTKLFNPESGLLGALRKVSMGAGRTTSIFDETDKLVNNIFGNSGVFVKFFKKLGQTFKVGDPLKIIISGIDFIGRVVEGISKFMDGKLFQSVLNLAKDLWDKITKTFKSIINNPVLNKVVELASEMLTKVVNMFRSIMNSPVAQEVGRIASRTFDTILGIFKNVLESPKIQELVSISENSLQGIVVFFRDVVKFSSDQLKKIDTTQVQNSFANITEVFNTLTRIVGGIYKETVGGNFDSSAVIKDIRQVGEGLRQFIKNIGKSVRGEDIEKPAEFGSTIIGTLVEETGKTVVVLIKEIFASLVDKAPEIAGKVLPALSKALNGMLAEAFGPLGGLVKAGAMFLPGPVGQIARASTGVDMFGGGGNLLSLAGIAGLAFAPQVIKGLRGANEGRRGIRDAFETIGEGGLGRYLYRRTLRDRTGRWKDGGSGSFLGIGSLRERYERGGSRERQRMESIAADLRDGPIRGRTDPITALMSLERSGQLNSNDFIYSSNISTGRMEASPRSLLNTSAQDAMEESERIQSLLDAEIQRRDVDSELRRRSGSWNRERNRRFRSSSRYRRGAMLGMSLRRIPRNIGRFIRSPMGARVGWGAAATGALAAGVGLVSLFSRPAKAADGGELSPQEQTIQAMLQQGYSPEEISQMGQGNAKQIASVQTKTKKQQEQQAQGNAAGSVLNGAMQGASMGMLFGPWGAAIGGVLGAGVALMDKGTKDGAMKFVKGLWDSFTKTLGQLTSFLSTQFDRFTSGVSNKFTEIGTNLSNLGRSIRNGVMKAGEFVGTAITNGLKFMANKVLDSITLIPRIFTFITKAIVDRVPDNLPYKKEALEMVKGADNILNTRFSYNNYLGRNDSRFSLDQALQREGRMSSGRPMVVNDSEFVIPRGGLSTLAEAMGGRVASRGGDSLTKVELSININNPVMLGDSKELVDSLRIPVLNIVNDAYRKINGVRARNQFIVT
jgi:hypothetical protein